MNFYGGLDIKGFLKVQFVDLLSLIFNVFQISDSGMVLEEQPAKVSEAFRLFLQGEGYGK